MNYQGSKTIEIPLDQAQNAPVQQNRSKKSKSLICTKRYVYNGFRAAEHVWKRHKKAKMSRNLGICNVWATSQESTSSIILGSQIWVQNVVDKGAAFCSTSNGFFEDSSALGRPYLTILFIFHWFYWCFVKTDFGHAGAVWPATRQRPYLL